MSKENGPAEEFELTIRVMGGEAVPITAPGDMLLEDLIAEFIEAVNLPGRNAKGSPTVWRLDDKYAGRTCNLNKTVREVCANKSNVELFLTQTFVAG